MTKNNCGKKLILFLTSCSLTSAGLLGAGTGEGSCAAPPFRSHEVQWSYGCPAFAPCCSEFGYCRPLSEWEYGEFRDCNGVSNGTPLPPEIIAAEEAAGPYHGTPAGEVGPPPEVIKAHHVEHGDHLPPPDQPPYAHPPPHHAALKAHSIHGPPHVAHAVHGPPHVPHVAHGPPHITHAVHGPPHVAHAVHGPPHVAHAVHGSPHVAHAVHGPPHVAHGVHGPPHVAHAVHGPSHVAHAVHGPPHVAHAVHSPTHVAHTLHGPPHVGSAVHGLPDVAHAVHGPSHTAHAVHGSNVAHAVHGLPDVAHAVHGPTHIAHAAHGPAVAAPHHISHAVHNAPALSSHAPVHATSLHVAHTPAFPAHISLSHPAATLPKPILAQPTPLVHASTPFVHQSASVVSHPAPVVPALAPVIAPALQVHHSSHSAQIEDPHGDINLVTPTLAQSDKSAQLRLEPNTDSSFSSVVSTGRDVYIKEKKWPMKILISGAPLFTTPAPTFPVTRETTLVNRGLLSRGPTRPSPSTPSPLSRELPRFGVTTTAPLFFTSPSPVTTQLPKFQSPSPSISLTPSRFTTPRPKPSEVSTLNRQPKLVGDAGVAVGPSSVPFSITTTQPRILQPVVNNLATSPVATIDAVSRTDSNLNFGNPRSASGIGNTGGQEIPQLQTALVPTIPRIPITPTDGSKCQHPKGSGSYTCLSFGAPQKPIFAFHTIQDEDGFVFGTGSGFPEDQNILLNEVDSQNAVRKIRKVIVSKDFIEKERGRRLKMFNADSRKSMPQSYDFNSQKKKRMVTYPTLNGLPITAYQEKLLLESESEQVFPKSNDNKSKQKEDNESVIVQKYEYPL